MIQLLQFWKSSLRLPGRSGEKPNPKDDAWWGLVWRKVRIPEADANGYRHYKTVVNDTYIP